MATATGVPTRSVIDAYEVELWSLAIVFFVVGDVVTTGLGYRMPGVVEASPLPAALLAEFGLVALLALKVVAVAGAYLVWTAIPREYAVGIPLAIALLGVLATGWNTTVLLRAAM